MVEVFICYFVQFLIRFNFVISYFIYLSCKNMGVNDISLEPCRNLMARQDITELGFGNSNLSGDKLEQV